ncbi:unnamed protein product [Nippostrongylus brasiliensis]|uniref:G protein-coupled receptor n=1 Tax=Nippostrongylus brasiliensis TaxID=27835 RepID=A0A0N4YXR9_NIPBR|nr:unnamed protein product [Nippostrongylus brasiliensis]
MVPAVIVERSFASCFIADYESIPRPWISSVVNAGSLILASLYYTIILLAMSICMFIVSSLTLVVIYRRDSGKLRDITGETGKYAINYTLSLKFQLAENVRVAKILVYFSAGLSAWGSFGCCLSASSLVIFGEAHAVGQLVYSLLNNYIAL